VAGMVADTELALDQISHTQTGPGALFIAQCFSTFSQQNMKPFPVLLRPARPALSKPAFPCRRYCTTQRATVCGTTPTRRATAAWVSPCSHKPMALILRFSNS
jgi:hypothetical protein